MGNKNINRLREIEFYCIGEAIHNALNPNNCVVEDIIEASDMEIKEFYKGNPIYGEKTNKALVGILKNMERAEKRTLLNLLNRIVNFSRDGLSEKELKVVEESALRLSNYAVEKGFQRIAKQFLNLYGRYTTDDIETKSENVQRILKSVVSGYARRKILTGRDFKDRAEELLNDFYEKTSDFATITTPIKTVGNNCSMILSAKN